MIALNNFGFGGSNIHLILKKPEVKHGLPDKFKFPRSKVYEMPLELISTLPFQSYSVKFEIDLRSPEYDCIKDHIVGGRNIFPTTGYLWALWNSIHWISNQYLYNIPLSETFIEFKNCKIVRSLPLGQKNLIRFETTFLKSTEKFVMKESGSVCMTGFIKIGTSIKGSFEKNEYFIENPRRRESDGSQIKKASQLYPHYRGYGWLYGPKFQNLVQIDMETNDSLIKFDGYHSWIPFVDAALQSSVFSLNDGFGIKIPSGVKYFYCDMKHLLEAKENNDGIFLSQFGMDSKMIKMDGIIMHFESESVPGLGKMSPKTVVESYDFVPLESKVSDSEKMDWIIVNPDESPESDNLIRNFPMLSILKIALLNIYGIACKVTELSSIENSLAKYVLISDLQVAEYKIFHSDEETEEKKLHPKVQLNKYMEDSVDVSQSDLVIVNLGSTIDFKSCMKLLESVDTKTMILLSFELEYLESLGKNMTMSSIIQMISSSTDFTILANHSDSDSLNAILLRKTVKSPVERIVTTVDDFGWIEKLKSFDRTQEETRIFLTCESMETGLIGLVKCLRLEDDFFRQNLRVVIGQKDDQEIPFEIMEKDLLYTIIKPEGPGCYVHQLIDDLSVKEEVYDVHLDVGQTGDLSSLEFYETTHERSSGEVKEINVAFSALNFKDVMIASGRIPTSAYPDGSSSQGNLGMEYSGTTTDGKRIMGMTSNNGIATKIHSDNPLWWDIPASMSLKDAATIPVAYTTVYYALFGRGKIKPKESVLIHSAAGAVGQAAVHVCLSLECEVFVTVGSEEKKEFLLKEFPKLKSENFFSSRNTEFEDGILKLTDGKGVDIILNSLAEEKLRSSIHCLGESGRFLEIGKYDITQNHEIDLSWFTENRSFHAICLAHLMDAAGNNELTSNLILQEVYSMIQTDLNNGNIKPLSTTVFGMNECEKAFRFMASGKHIGKILIQMTNPDEAHLYTKINANQSLHLDPEKSYIIIGGMGGFGLFLFKNIYDRGGRKILMTSRTYKRFEDTVHNFKAIMEEYGFEIRVIQRDCTDLIDAYEIIEEAEKMGPVGGIFNLAVNLADAMFENQSKDSFEKVSAAKIIGTQNLDYITRNRCPKLDHFVCFSSIVAGRGNKGQSNYGFANSFMDMLCERRREAGFPGLSIQWGPIADVGIYAKTHGDAMFNGINPQPILTSMTVMDKLMLQKNSSVYSTFDYDESVMLATSGNGRILDMLYNLMGIKDISTVDKSRTLTEIGVDSMLTVEIREIILRETGKKFESNDVRKLTLMQLESMMDASSTSAKPTPAAIKKSVPGLSGYSEEMFTEYKHLENYSKTLFYALPMIESFATTGNMLDSFTDTRIICIRWVEELDQCDSFQDVAKNIAVNLIQTYPQNGTQSGYIFGGYSYGAILGHAIAQEIQIMSGVESVQKMIYFDITPIGLLDHEYLDQMWDPDDLESNLTEIFAGDAKKYFITPEIQKKDERKEETIIKSFLEAVNPDVIIDIEFINRSLGTKLRFSRKYTREFRQNPQYLKNAMTCFIGSFDYQNHLEDLKDFNFSEVRFDEKKTMFNFLILNTDSSVRR